MKLPVGGDLLRLDEAYTAQPSRKGCRKPDLWFLAKPSHQPGPDPRAPRQRPLPPPADRAGGLRVPSAAVVIDLGLFLRKNLAFLLLGRPSPRFVKGLNRDLPFLQNDRDGREAAAPADSVNGAHRFARAVDASAEGETATIPNSR